MDTDNKSGDDVRLEFNDIFNCGSDITQGNTQNDQHAGIEGGAESGNRRCQSPAIAIPQKGMPHHNKKRTYDINGADPSSGDPTPTVSTHVKPEADEAPFTGGSLSFTALFEYNHGDAESTILDHKSSDMVIPQNGASPQIQADQQQPASTINDFNATSVVKFTLFISPRQDTETPEVDAADDSNTTNRTTTPGASAQFPDDETSDDECMFQFDDDDDGDGENLGSLVLI